jgi:hypothetical protein
MGIPTQRANAKEQQGVAGTATESARNVKSFAQAFNRKRAKCSAGDRARGGERGSSAVSSNSCHFVGQAIACQEVRWRFLSGNRLTYLGKNNPGISEAALSSTFAL